MVEADLERSSSQRPPPHLLRLESTMKINLLTLFLVALGFGLVLLFPVNMNDITSVRGSGRS